MTDSPPDPPRETLNKSELIESIYRIALEPQTYDEFMARWEEFILGQIARLNDAQDDVTALKKTIEEPEIETHLNIASRLIDQVGRDDEMQTVDRGAPPKAQMLFTRNGVMVWHNKAAQRVFRLKHGAVLDDFGLSPDHGTAVKALLAGTGSGRVVLVKMARPDGKRSLAMSFRMSDQTAEEPLFMASEVRQGWPVNTGALLVSGFGLSAAEIDICMLLVAGQTAAAIAQTRASALGTVRTQIKNILHKTDTPNQVELVNLLHATMRLAEADAPVNHPETHPPDSVLNIQLPARTMPVETFGDPGGTPVIFFHGMLDGKTMPPRMRQLLKEHHFRLLCPVRPSFGDAAPDETGPIATAPQRFAADIETLMTQHKLAKPILLGHLAGGLWAYAAAARLGDRAAGLLAVGAAVPILSTAQFASMSTLQRITATTARYTPRMLPFIIRAAINQINHHGEGRLLRSLYRNSPDDQRTLANPEVRDIIIAGYHFTVAQGPRGFEIDGYHLVRDWTPLVDATRIPIEILHGAQDPVVSIASVKAFQDTIKDRARLEVLPDSGQLIIYKSPDAVIAALKRLRGDADAT